jgi:hypothetical protein
MGVVSKYTVQGNHAFVKIHSISEIPHFRENEKKHFRFTPMYCTLYFEVQSVYV